MPEQFRLNPGAEERDDHDNYAWGEGPGSQQPRGGVGVCPIETPPRPKFPFRKPPRVSHAARSLG